MPQPGNVKQLLYPFLYVYIYIVTFSKICFGDAKQIFKNRIRELSSVTLYTFCYTRTSLPT